MSSSKREQISLMLEPGLRESLTRWAEEEGRPVGNLLRRLVAKAVAQHVRRRASAGAEQA